LQTGDNIGLQIAQPFVTSFSAKIFRDIECLDLRKKLFFNKSARYLQGSFVLRRVSRHEKNKRKIII
jgi:hypothetical protein